jgi:hypothetical protein
MSIAVMETSGSHLEIVDERIAKGNLVDGGGVPQVTMVNCLSVEVKLRGYTGEVILVGNYGGSIFRESFGGRMEIGSTSKGEVGEDARVLYQYSLDTQEYLPEDLLLQYEEDEIRKDLEGSGRMLISPLGSGLGYGHPPRVSPRWVVERVKGFYHVVGLSCEGYEDKMLELFEEIEAARDQTIAENTTYVPSTPRAKGQRELNRLAWSLKYEKKGVQSLRG